MLGSLGYMNRPASHAAMHQLEFTIKDFSSKENYDHIKKNKLKEVLQKIEGLQSGDLNVEKSAFIQKEVAKLLLKIQ